MPRIAAPTTITIPTPIQIRRERSIFAKNARLSLQRLLIPFRTPEKNASMLFSYSFDLDHVVSIQCASLVLFLFWFAVFLFIRVYQYLAVLSRQAEFPKRLAPPLIPTTTKSTRGPRACANT